MTTITSRVLAFIWQFGSLTKVEYHGISAHSTVYGRLE